MTSNYRPITIYSSSLKIFEYCMLGHLKNRLKLNPRPSTTVAALILKETIMSYTHTNSNVYAFFLDLSKGFDKVNHFILINKLCSSKVSCNCKYSF